MMFGERLVLNFCTKLPIHSFSWQVSTEIHVMIYYSVQHYIHVFDGDINEIIQETRSPNSILAYEVIPKHIFYIGLEWISLNYVLLFCVKHSQSLDFPLNCAHELMTCPILESLMIPKWLSWSVIIQIMIFGDKHI